MGVCVSLTSVRPNLRNTVPNAWHAPRTPGARNGAAPPLLRVQCPDPRRQKLPENQRESGPGHVRPNRPTGVLGVRSLGTGEPTPGIRGPPDARGVRGPPDARGVMRMGMTATRALNICVETWGHEMLKNQVAGIVMGERKLFNKFFEKTIWALIRHQAA